MLHVNPAATNGELCLLRRYGRPSDCAARPHRPARTGWRGAPRGQGSRSADKGKRLLGGRIPCYQDEPSEGGQNVHANRAFNLPQMSTRRFRQYRIDACRVAGIALHQHERNLPLGKVIKPFLRAAY
jgi:hypothetical protein